MIWDVTKKVIKHSTTEADNETFDVIRISFFLSDIAAIVFTAYAIWKSGVFDVFAFTTGLGALLGGGGAGMGARAKLEGPVQAPFRPQGPTGIPPKPAVVRPAEAFEEGDEEIKPPRMGV